MYSVVRSSVDWKPAVPEVLNLLEFSIYLALSVCLVRQKCSASGTLCVFRESRIVRRAVKFEDCCDDSVPPPVLWFKDEPNEAAIVHCILIASDVCKAFRCWVSQQMWANSISVHMEMNVIKDWAYLLFQLTAMQASRRATLIDLSCTLTRPQVSAGMKGSRWEIGHPAGLPGGGGGFYVLSYPSKSAYSMNKQQLPEVPTHTIMVLTIIISRLWLTQATIVGLSWFTYMAIDDLDNSWCTYQPWAWCTATYRYFWLSRSHNKPHLQSQLVMWWWEFDENQST